MKRNLLLNAINILSLVLFIQGLGFSQQIQTTVIRKNYREMGPQEISDFRDALQHFWNTGSSSTNGTAYPTSTPTIADFAILWDENSPQVSWGVPTHYMMAPNWRGFLLDWEIRLRSHFDPTFGYIYDYLSVPYWDWREDADASNTTNITPINYPDFWAYTFLPVGLFDGTGSNPLWSYTYTSGILFPSTSRTLSFSRATNFAFSPNDINTWASSTIVNNAVTHSTFDGQATGHGFTDITYGTILRNIQGLFISQTIGAAYSPLDPAFFLHGCMADKMWKDWQDNFQGNYPNFTTQNNTQAYLHLYPTTSGNDVRETRSIGFNSTVYRVWYAEDGTVLINGAKGNTLNIFGNSRVIYRYTVYDWVNSSYEAGDMYVGDAIRSGTSIVPSTSSSFGGDVNVNGSDIHFRAGNSITFMPGFSATPSTVTNHGITAKIINAPNGF